MDKRYLINGLVRLTVIYLVFYYANARLLAHTIFFQSNLVYIQH